MFSSIRMPDPNKRVCGVAVRSLVQAATILCFAFALIAILWAQQPSTIAAGRTSADGRRAPSGQEHWSKCDLAEFRNMRIDQEPTSLPRIGDPGRVREILPARAQYDVTIKGGVTAERDDRAWGRQSWPYVVYVFEVGYRRTIESNDGHKIVERRTYNFARMAKLLTTVDDLALNLKPGQDPVFAGIDFPGPDSSIHVGDASEFAARALEAFDASIAHPDTSLCLLQRNPLHGKSVRLTYVDGVGVKSVETFGKPLPNETMRYLFGQRILPMGIHCESNGPSDDHIIIDREELMRFCDPGKPVLPGTEVRVTTNANRTRAPRNRYAVRRLDSDQTVLQHVRTKSNPRPLKQETLGSVLFDASGTFVRRANFRWQYPELEAPEGHVLFEQPYRDVAGTSAFLVHYDCRAVRHAATRTR